jgi:Ca2+-transporting ATPase
MPTSPGSFSGLNAHEVHASRKTHGANMRRKGTPASIRIILGVMTEPMLVLLVAACITYFILGSIHEGYFMAASILFVAGISVFQQYRSEHALKELGRLTAHPVKVFRDGVQQTVPSSEIVVGDVMMIAEGEQVNADAEILQLNDLSIDESVLTGESLPVEDKKPGDLVLAGTTVVKGMAVARVSKVGDDTRLGGMGLLMEEAKRGKTPLEKQVGSFVRTMAFFGITAFLLVWLMNYLKSGDLLASLMHGLTLAMAVLPEEIPVALASFMALGAYRMVRKQVLARHPQTVEALGAATVICLDKTGTITENKMEVSGMYLFESNKIWVAGADGEKQDFAALMHTALLASERDPFDPMEQAIIRMYRDWYGQETVSMMFHEYPLAGKPPMMTHVHRMAEGSEIIAAKGAVETLLPLCNLSAEKQSLVIEHMKRFASMGHRVLAVAKGIREHEALPESQFDIPFEFLGLVALSDPPKKDMVDVVRGFYQSGIDVKMITGDHPETALNIAEKIGLKHGGDCVSGDEIEKMEDEQLSDVIGTKNVFARIMPETKLRIIEALRKRGEVVAMTGDGVNDAPALKAANIGIAMGHHGSEVARQASSLVLLNDQLGAMIAAIQLGRTIYANLKRAISYIIAIHIPLISVVTLPLLFGWQFADIFSPVHIIFLELIMGPTCSIVFENEPAKPGIMNHSPRKQSDALFTWRELAGSLLRGMAITAALLATMFIMHQSGYNQQSIRTVVFMTLVLSNILLTLTGRSESDSMWVTIRYKNMLVPIMSAITVMLLVLLIYFHPAASLFKFESAQIWHWMVSLGVASAAVLWIEIYKAVRRT